MKRQPQLIVSVSPIVVRGTPWNLKQMSFSPGMTLLSGNYQNLEIVSRKHFFFSQNREICEVPKCSNNIIEPVFIREKGILERDIKAFWLLFNHYGGHLYYIYCFSNVSVYFIYHYLAAFMTQVVL